jgi:hypothetical protein
MAMPAGQDVIRMAMAVATRGPANQSLVTLVNCTLSSTTPKLLSSRPAKATG